MKIQKERRRTLTLHYTKR